MTDTTRLFNRYLLEEYPAEIIKLPKIENSFLKKRKRAISITKYYYVFLIVLVMLQIIGCLWPWFNSGNINEAEWKIALLKGFVLLLGFLSLHAWKSQLRQNEEFYAWALYNYSQYEPLYETLRSINRKKNNSSGHNEIYLIISEWLKNRPSLVYLLITCGSVVSITKLPCWIEPDALTCFWIETALSLIFLFVFCIPFCSWSYIKKRKKTSTQTTGNEDTSEKNDQFEAKDKFFLFCICLVAFAIIFELPICLVAFIPNQNGIFVLILVVLLIYIFLFWFFGKLVKKNRKTDKEKINFLDLSLPSIAELSGKGQIDYLLQLLEQNQNLDLKTLDTWEKEAKTAHALEIIYELELH